VLEKFAVRESLGEEYELNGRIPEVMLGMTREDAEKVASEDK
jgi:hypothetical protein